LLVFLTAAYFFMARETTLVDMTSCISKIVDVRLDVLVDFPVVLARVIDVVAPSSPMERLSIIAVLVGEMTSAGAAIRSWHGRSANRAHRVGRSLILVDLINLVVRRFKLGGDLGDLYCLRELSELIGSYSQVGAWGFVDIMAINKDKFIIKVMLEWEWPSLRVELIIASSLG